MNLKVYCDGSVTGGSWASKKVATVEAHSWCGWYVCRTDNILIHYKSLDLGKGPNRSGNFSEYFAIRSALNWLHENHPLANVQLYSDSRIAIDQIKDVINCYNETLLIFRNECRELANTFPSVKFNWIPRTKNTIADTLSRCKQPKFGGRELTYAEVQSIINAHCAGTACDQASPTLAVGKK